jgi:hypothetical protein
VARYAFTDRVLFPIAACYEAMRDHMTDFAPYLDGIREIRVLERTALAPGRWRIVNEWVPDYAAPAVISRFVSADMFRWIDRVLWDDEARSWRYEIDFPLLPGIVRCRGENGMRPAGPAETEVFVEGDLEIYADRLPGVPAFFGRSVRPSLERFVIGLVEPRLRGIDAGLARFLEARGGARRRGVT